MLKMILKLSSFQNKSNESYEGLGRNLCPIFVQFRCPRSPTTFSPYDSMDFYVLNSNFNVVTSKNLQFFCNLRSKIDLFPLETSCYLQLLY